MSIQLFDFSWQYQPDEEGDQPPANALEIGDPADVTPLDINIKNILSDKQITLNPIAGVTQASTTNYHFKLAFEPGILNTPEGIGVEGNNWSIYPHSDGNADSLYLLWKGGKITISPNDFLPQAKEIILTGVAATSGVSDESQFIDLAATTTVVTISWQFKQGEIEIITVHFPEFKRHPKYQTELNLTLTMVKTTGKSNIPLFVGFVGSNTVVNIDNEVSSLKLRITNTNTTTGENSNITFHYDNDPAKCSQLVVMLEAGKDDWALGTGDEVNGIDISIEGGQWNQKSKEQVLVERQVKDYKWIFLPQSSDVILQPQQTMLIDLGNIVTSKAIGETNLYLSYNDVPGYKDGQFIRQIQKSPFGLEVNGTLRAGKVGVGIHEQYGRDLNIDLAVGDSDTGLKWISDGNFAIYNNNSEKVRFDSSGNVGIGTSSPSKKLEVNGDLKATGGLNIDDAALIMGALSIGTNLTVGDTTNTGYLNVTDKVGIGTTSPSEKLEVDGTTKTTDLTVTDKVGIGTTSPSEKLEVDGTTKTTDLTINGGAVNFGSSNGQKLNLWEEQHGIGVQSYTTYFRSSQDFGWYKGGSHNDGELNPGGGTVQMVIKDGDVGIGTASPSAKLDVDGTIKCNQLQIGETVIGENELKILKALWNENLVIMLRNTTYNDEYLYASSIQFDKDRREVCTWIPGNEVNQCYWKVALKSWE